MPLPESLQPVRVTWQLWDALWHPPRRHPLFHRLRDVPRATHSTRAWLVLGLAGLLFGGILLMSIALGGLTLVVIAGGLALSSTLIGTRWVQAISGAIAQMHADGRYDLLAISPLAGLGAMWGVAQGYVHRYDDIQRIGRVTRWLALFGLGLLVPAVLADWLIGASGQLTVALLPIIGGSVLIGLDYRQTLVTAVLVGLLIPTWRMSATTTRLFASLAFVALQAVIYALLALFYVFLLLALMAIIAPPLANGIALVSGLGAYYLARDLILTGVLWGVLVRWRNHS